MKTEPLVIESRHANRMRHLQRTPSGAAALVRMSLPRAATAALLLAQLTACMTWRPVRGTLEQQVGAEPLPRARLMLRDGSELPLRDVTVRADSVIGYTESSRERRARPVADVASIDRRQVSGGRTAVAIGTSVLGLAYLFALASVATITSGGMF